MVHPDNDIRSLGPRLTELVQRLEAVFPYAAVLVTDTAGESVRVSLREESVTPTLPQRGVVISAFTGETMLEEATDNLTPEALAEAAARLIAGGRALGVTPGGAPDAGDERLEAFAVEEIRPFETVPVGEKLALARRLRDVAAGSSKVVNAFGAVGHTRVRELFVNRNRRLYQDVPRNQTVAGVTVRNGAESASLYEGDARQGGWETAGLADDLIQRMTADCEAICGAPRPPAGTWDCIFSPAFAGMFAHEAFGHGTESDMFVKRRARGAEFMGKPVASPLVNLSDAPNLPGAAASFFFDHEGQIAGYTRIVQNGILKAPITDMLSAHRLRLTRSANGRRESFARKAYARMTNTFFEGGTSTFAEMLADIDYGFYLTRPSNGMEDPKGWGIQLEGYMASEIEHGRLTGRVFSPVIITGYVPELLGSITMVGNDFSINGLGMCGKGHKEWVKVTDGGPHLRLKARIA